jgi:hypothetical protein
VRLATVSTALECVGFVLLAVAGWMIVHWLGVALLAIAFGIVGYAADGTATDVELGSIWHRVRNASTRNDR